jgi:hypothetical protein
MSAEKISGSRLGKSEKPGLAIVIYTCNFSYVEFGGRISV